MSDNKKLNLKQYKQLIYERIKKIYAEQGAETPSVIEYKKSASSIHRATEVFKEKHYDHRQSFNSYKGAKVSASHSKYNQPSPSMSYHYTTLNDEERDKMKRKQSLKDILKNKR